MKRIKEFSMSQFAFYNLFVFVLTLSACQPEASIPTLAPTVDAPAPASDEPAAELPTAVPTESVVELPEEGAAEDPVSDTPLSSGRTVSAGGEAQASAPPEQDENEGVPAGDGSQEETQLTADLAGMELHWLGNTDPDGQSTLVADDPTSYTIEFNDDGTFAWKAVCSQGIGGYQQDGAELFLDLGAVTLSVCAGGSLGDQYIQYLRNVESFTTDTSQVLLQLGDGSDHMVFNRGASMESESSEGAVTGIQWQWTSFSDPAEGQLAVEEPEKYTLVLFPDGTAAAKADCSEILGSYSLEKSAITIVLEPTSAQDCGAESSSEAFTRSLNAAAIYFFQDNDLFIDLIYDSGTMRFENSGAVER